LNENDAMPEIEQVSGHEFLRSAATEAARQGKIYSRDLRRRFARLTRQMYYNFVPPLENANYTTAAKVEDFPTLNEIPNFTKQSSI
jgi:hypothetical protein